MKKSIFPYFVTRALLFVMLVSLLITSFYGHVRAADIINRNVTLGTSEPSATTEHSYRFVNTTAAVLGSIRFEYCVNSPLFTVACTPPAGLNVNAAVLDSQSGNVGFSVNGGLSNAHTIIINRVPVGSLATTNRYSFSNIVNPSSADTTFYVRVSLYSSADASGARYDQGALAFSTSGSFSIGLFVPPFLIFCVGVTVAPDCTSATGNIVTFGELSKNSENVATTQFAVATNDESGHQVFLNGQTMTSGNNAIPALESRTSSSPGTSQFGVNLRSNSSPSVGANPSGNGSTTATSDYNSSNQFAFSSGDVIARSARPTDYNVFTVSYLVNVSEDQAPGVYAATLIYTALATF